MVVLGRDDDERVRGRQTRAERHGALDITSGRRVDEIDVDVGARLGLLGEPAADRRPSRPSPVLPMITARRKRGRTQAPTPGGDAGRQPSIEAIARHAAGLQAGERLHRAPPSPGPTAPCPTGRSQPDARPVDPLGVVQDARAVEADVEVSADAAGGRRRLGVEGVEHQIDRRPLAGLVGALELHGPDDHDAPGHRRVRADAAAVAAVERPAASARDRAARRGSAPPGPGRCRRA